LSQRGSFDAQTDGLTKEKVCVCIVSYFWWLNFYLAVVKGLVFKI
jgi:hypothetical protein